MKNNFKVWQRENYDPMILLSYGDMFRFTKFWQMHNIPVPPHVFSVAKWLNKVQNSRIGGVNSGNIMTVGFRQAKGRRKQKENTFLTLRVETSPIANPQKASHCLTHTINKNWGCRYVQVCSFSEGN